MGRWRDYEITASVTESEENTPDETDFMREWRNPAEWRGSHTQLRSGTEGGPPQPGGSAQLKSTMAALGGADRLGSLSSSLSVTNQKMLQAQAHLLKEK